MLTRSITPYLIQGQAFSSITKRKRIWELAHKVARAGCSVAARCIPSGVRSTKAKGFAPQRSIYFSPCSKFDIFVFYKTNSICFRFTQTRYVALRQRYDINPQRNFISLCRVRQSISSERHSSVTRSIAYRVRLCRRLKSNISSGVLETHIDAFRTGAKCHHIFARRRARMRFSSRETLTWVSPRTSATRAWDISRK